MDTEPPQPGPSGSKSSWLAGASTNTSPIGTQQYCWHQLVHRDIANSARKNMTQDVHLKIVCKTGSSTNRNQHAVGCEYIHTVIHGHQSTVYHAAGVRRELRNQFIAARNGNPPWSSNAFVRTFREIEHHDVISSGIFAEQFRDKHSWGWTKQALITLEEATEAYMVEVIAASHCLTQQLISCRYSTCLLRWQGKEVVYRWNSLTCAWPWTWPKWPKEGSRVPQQRKHNT